ncbi:MAG: thioesterase [Treponema sp.]|nr:thioesterase [Treponema sp.]
MESPIIHRRDFRLRYYEMDAYAEATPVTILNLLEETAFSHCEESGWDVYRLVSEGYGWILLRGGIEMRRYPSYREAFSIESWCSGTKNFYGTREYRILSPSGELLGFARSLWLFFSLERRRPVPVLPDIVEAWRPGGPPAGDLELGAVEGPGPESVEASRSFEVRLSDIDTNGHVNNVNYLAWAIESMPPEARRQAKLTRLRGQFKHEVEYGSTVRPAFRAEADRCLHGAYATRPGETEPYLAAAAESVWTPRPAPESAAAAESRGPSERGRTGETSFGQSRAEEVRPDPRRARQGAGGLRRGFPAPSDRSLALPSREAYIRPGGQP